MSKIVASLCLLGAVVALTMAQSTSAPQSSSAAAAAKSPSFSEQEIISALKKFMNDRKLTKVRLTNKGQQDNDADEIEMLSKQLAGWCRESGRCSIEEGLAHFASKGNDNDDSDDGDDDARNSKRGVGAVNDLCKLYRVKCKRGFTPFRQQLEEEDDVSGDKSAQISKRSASSIGDLCKLYGMKCRREDEDDSESTGNDGEDKIYRETVRNFLKLCHRYKKCDFRSFVQKLAVRVQRLLSSSIDDEIGDCIKTGLCRLPEDGSNKSPVKPRELMLDDASRVIEIE